jgi:ubiquinone/menaquinone biosynthesis C-methylase UbiE
MDPIENIRRIYGTEALGDKLLDSLAAAGCNIAKLSTADLIAFDELHIMGKEATLALGRQAGIHAGMHVLDIGCGVGGPARSLAENFGCRVVGVDLSESFISAAATLTSRVGLAPQVAFQYGDALELPFEAGCFDVAVMIHLSMNIRDKNSLFQEAHRVLRPGGRLALWEVCRGAGEIIFPVPWADNAAFSYVVAMDDMVSLLTRSGFEKVEWEDATSQAGDWVRQRVRAAGKSAPARKTPDLDLILPDFRRKRANISKNLLQGTLRILKAVAITRT